MSQVTQMKPCKLDRKAGLHLGGNLLYTLTDLPPFSILQTPVKVPPLLLSGPWRESSKAHQAWCVAAGLILLQENQPCPGSW